MGKLATPSSTPWGSTGAKPRLAAASDNDAHEPLPGARTAPAIGAPVRGSTAVMNRTPPVARALNSLGSVEAKLKFCESAHTKAPLSFARARLPAAKL